MSRQSYPQSGELALKVGIAGHDFSLLYWLILGTIMIIIPQQMKKIVSEERKM